MYHKIYDDKKIFNAVINGTINDLNKNLKSKAEKIISAFKKLSKENT